MADEGLHSRESLEGQLERNGEDLSNQEAVARTVSNVVDQAKKVCILSIDGGGMRGIIPGKILARLETLLKEKSGNPDARIADYFDVAAGTSVGGIITTMLFTDNGTGSPLFTGEEAWQLIAQRGREIFRIPASKECGRS
jgi:patatin-like phospholipase/acyl hydrolase